MESSSYWLFGEKMIIRTDGSSNGNLYNTIEGTFPAGAKTPPHVHAEFAETVVALEGELISYGRNWRHNYWTCRNALLTDLILYKSR